MQFMGEVVICNKKTRCNEEFSGCLFEAWVPTSLSLPTNLDLKRHMMLCYVHWNIQAIYFKMFILRWLYKVISCNIKKYWNSRPLNALIHWHSTTSSFFVKDIMYIHCYCLIIACKFLCKIPTYCLWCYLRLNHPYSM